jgi:hypothetical protein
MWNRGDTPSPVTIDLAVVGEPEAAAAVRGRPGRVRRDSGAGRYPGAGGSHRDLGADGRDRGGGRPVTRWWWICVPLAVALLVVGLLTRRRARR